LAHLGYPVCGDPAYQAGNTLGESQTLAVDDPPLCLHAWRISFRHPLDKQSVTFTAPPPSWVGR
jgi:23S rRNA-/tRNA-specific pseudouridylate synthase